MSKPKYYYAVVNKENGRLLTEDHKLPFYWIKRIAQETVKKFNGYIVIRVNIEDIENLFYHLNL